MNKKYIGYFNTTNTGGCFITSINDKIIKFDVVTDRVLAQHKLKLHYNNKGIYFNYGSRIYLHEIIKVI